MELMKLRTHEHAPSMSRPLGRCTKSSGDETVLPRPLVNEQKSKGKVILQRILQLRMKRDGEEKTITHHGAKGMILLTTYVFGRSDLRRGEVGYWRLRLLRHDEQEDLGDGDVYSSGLHGAGRRVVRVERVVGRVAEVEGDTACKIAALVLHSSVPDQPDKGEVERDERFAVVDARAGEKGEEPILEEGGKVDGSVVCAVDQ
ncbi:hypothetical protein B0H19DRAFT_1083473 [Mycena capillaripes]|nr:hypothetical protein B0H19DRAFT_1083473 [Mycena capillaripes]